MNWAEIKKSINSDLGTPLNTLITTNTTSLGTQITDARNHIETAGNIKSVKSVQRGALTINKWTTQSSAYDVYYNITISSVNVNKSVVFLNYSVNNNYTYYPVGIQLVNATQIKLCMGMNSSDTYYIRWQVIEFY